MRQIKFRGRNKYDGNWAYGDLISQSYPAFPHVSAPLIMDNNGGAWEVLPESVGQFIGIHDKNGKEIYEGHICQGLRGEDDLWVVRFKNGAFHFCKEDAIGPIFECAVNNKFWGEGYTIMGNIHENYDLAARKREVKQ